MGEVHKLPEQDAAVLTAGAALPTTADVVDALSQWSARFTLEALGFLIQPILEHRASSLPTPSPGRQMLPGRYTSATDVSLTSAALCLTTSLLFTVGPCEAAASPPTSAHTVQRMLQQLRCFIALSRTIELTIEFGVQNEEGDAGQGERGLPPVKGSASVGQGLYPSVQMHYQNTFLLPPSSSSVSLEASISQHLDLLHGLANRVFANRAQGGVSQYLSGIVRVRCCIHHLYASIPVRRVAFTFDYARERGDPRLAHRIRGYPCSPSFDRLRRREQDGLEHAGYACMMELILAEALHRWVGPRAGPPRSVAGPSCAFSCNLSPVNISADHTPHDEQEREALRYTLPSGLRRLQLSFSLGDAVRVMSEDEWGVLAQRAVARIVFAFFPSLLPPTRGPEESIVRSAAFPTGNGPLNTDELPSSAYAALRAVLQEEVPTAKSEKAAFQRGGSVLVVFWNSAYLRSLVGTHVGRSSKFLHMRAAMDSIATAPLRRDPTAIRRAERQLAPLLPILCSVYPAVGPQHEVLSSIPRRLRPTHPYARLVKEVSAAMGVQPLAVIMTPDLLTPQDVLSESYALANQVVSAGSDGGSNELTKESIPLPSSWEMVRKKRARRRVERSGGKPLALGLLEGTTATYSTPLPPVRGEKLQPLHQIIRASDMGLEESDEEEEEQQSSAQERFVALYKAAVERFLASESSPSPPATPALGRKATVPSPTQPEKHVPPPVSSALAFQNALYHTARASLSPQYGTAEGNHSRTLALVLGSALRRTALPQDSSPAPLSAPRRTPMLLVRGKAVQVHAAVGKGAASEAEWQKLRQETETPAHHTAQFLPPAFSEVTAWVPRKDVVGALEDYGKDNRDDSFLCRLCDTGAEQVRRPLLLQWNRKFVLMIDAPSPSISVPASPPRGSTTPAVSWSRWIDTNDGADTSHSAKRARCLVVPPNHRWWVLDPHAMHERIRLEFFLVFVEAYVEHPELPSAASVWSNSPHTNVGKKRVRQEPSANQGLYHHAVPVLMERIRQSRAVCGALEKGESHSPATSSHSAPRCFPVRIPDDLVPRVETMRAHLWAWGWRFTLHPTTKQPQYIVHFPALFIEGFQFQLTTVNDLRVMLEELECCGTETGRPALANAPPAPSSGPAVIPSAILTFLISRSCRGAIMLGDVVMPDMMWEWLQCLRPVQQYHCCAHGRPSAALLIPSAIFT